MTEKATTDQVDPVALRDLVADTLDIAPEQITDDAHFIDDLGVDSLLSLELVVSLEREYKIKIESSEISDVVRMRDVMQLVEGKLAARV